jgi:asparagine synthase (glutamine-hydrolysing)
VIEISEGIPFIELTDWDHGKLYDLKGRIVQSGIRQVTGIDMPVFPKRRFQHGAVSTETFQTLFPKYETEYRRELNTYFA